MSGEEDKKAELRKKIEYQVACEERAFRIVEQLIDNPITAQQLLDALQFITPDHYNDIVEERAVSKLCGYPVCGKTLSNVPKQKYVISTKTNKVYDIESKKNFCSGRCYKASLYLQKQIATSPVWARQKQPPVRFELLPLDGKSGYVGDEVIISQREEMKQDLAKLERLDKYQEALQKRKVDEKCSLPPRDGAKEGGGKGVSESEANYEGKTGKHVGMKGDAEETCRVQNDEHDGIIADRKTVNSDSIVDDQHFVTDENDQSVYTLERALGEMKIGGDVDDADMDRSVSEIALEKSESKENLVKISQYSGRNDSKDGKPYIGTERDEQKAEIQKCVYLKERTGEPIASSQNDKFGPYSGESKTDYLMRLLDKRKNMLAKMADIQPLSAEGQDNAAAGKSANEVMNSDNDSSSVHPVQAAAGVMNTRTVTEVQVKSVVENENIDKDTMLDKTSDKYTKVELKSTKNVGKSKDACDKKKRISLAEKKVSSPCEKIEADNRHSVSTLQLICKTVKAWITVESLEYLNTKESEETDPGKTEFERQYKALERKVDQQERDFDKMLGEEVLGEDDAMDRPSGPLPHFEVLKREVEDDTVRVQEFLKGSFTYKVEERDTTKAVESGKKVILPSVDRYDQMLIRQRIVLERISKVLPSLLTPLHLLVQHVFTELRELVFTFNLTKDNILFKPAEWMLVALVLLKLISCKNSSVRKAFGTIEAENYVSIVLRGAGSNLGELENCVIELTRPGVG